MKNLAIRLFKKTFFVSWWSLIAAILLMHFFYYGAFPTEET